MKSLKKEMEKAKVCAKGLKQKVESFKTVKGAKEYKVKVDKREQKKMREAQQKAMRELSSWMKKILLVMPPGDAFKLVSLIKNAGVFDLFVALGKGTKLLNHLKKGKELCTWGD